MDQHSKELNNDIIASNETGILENKHLYNDRDLQTEEVGDSDLKLREATNLCERELKSEEREKPLGDEIIEQKYHGRRFITIRNLPLSADTNKFRKEISKVCPPVSMGVVRINNMGYKLLHIQYRNKDNIESLYQCLKQNKYVLH